MQLVASSFALHTPCPRCRKQVLPQAAFCPRCGVRLRATQYSAPIARPIVATPFGRHVPVIGLPKTLGYAPPRPNEKPKRVTTSNAGKGRWAAIFAAVMVTRFFASVGNHSSTSSPPITPVPPMPRLVPPPQISVPRLSPPVYTPANPRIVPRTRDGRPNSVNDPRFIPVPNQPGVYRYSPAR